ncbi:MAG: hypothetical protein PHI98_08170 [Eubacteriales bacterium]|nr:hypothetical protein [Eubacteriales bacterium]
MENNWNAYRKHLKTQNLQFSILAIFLLGFLLCASLLNISPVAAEARWADGWNGFILGAGTAVIFLCVIGIVMNLRAIKSDEALKKLYIKEHDERKTEIQKTAFLAAYWPEVLGLMLGVIIGGYFNPVVSLTCLGCLLYLCVVRILFKIYYSKKL